MLTYADASGGAPASLPKATGLNFNVFGADKFANANAAPAKENQVYVYIYILYIYNYYTHTHTHTHTHIHTHTHTHTHPPTRAQRAFAQTLTHTQVYRCTDVGVCKHL
jgi:hypothetical protein